MKYPVLSTLALILALSIAASCEDGGLNTKCTFKELPSPPHTRQASAGGINDSGAIVGTLQKLAAVGSLNGFLLFHGKLTQFNFPGASGTDAFAINNRGQIVGTYRAADPNDRIVHGFTVHSGGFRNIDIPGALATEALGINDAGDVSGWTELSDDTFHGFLMRRGHLKIISFPGAFQTFAVAINNHGDIVGSYVLQIASNIDEVHGFLLKDGIFKTIDVPGGSVTSVFAINDAGDLVGSYSDNKGTSHGFSFVRGTFTTIDVPDRMDTSLTSINNHGQVIASTRDINFATRVSVGTCRFSEKGKDKD
jgi:uncharacterized membrane protein